MKNERDFQPDESVVRRYPEWVRMIVIFSAAAFGILFWRGVIWVVFQ